MVVVVGVRSVSIDATVFPDAEGAERGHSLFGRVPRPGAQNEVYTAGLKIEGQDVALCGVRHMEITVMDLE